MMDADFDATAREANPADEWEAPPVERPETIPEKFWDPDAGQVRVDALAKSYSELERKLGAAAAEIPQAPDGYRIDAEGLAVGPDPEVNARLHAAGFSQDQARVVYDLANQYLPSMVTELAAEFEAQRQLDGLMNHYGGRERWQQTAQQLRTWGRQHLPSEVYEALATTREGILAMERMMASGEPGLMSGGSGGAGAMSENDLKEMMRDPRYWRERDPAVVDRVRAGFRRLFPGEG